MAYEGQEVISHTIVAVNDFRTLHYRVVDITGDLAVAGGAMAGGIVQSQPNSGQFMHVGVLGVMKAFAGAVITTPGYPLTTAASGWVIAAVSGSTVVGRYLQTAACASGDLVTGLFNFASPRPLGAGSGYV